MNMVTDMIQKIKEHAIVKKIKKIVESIVINVTDYIIIVEFKIRDIVEHTLMSLPKPVESFARGFLGGLKRMLLAAPELCVLILAAIGMSFIIYDLAFITWLPAIVEAKHFTVAVSFILVGILASLSDMSYNYRYGE